MNPSNTGILKNEEFSTDKALQATFDGALQRDNESSFQALSTHALLSFSGARSSASSNSLIAQSENNLVANSTFDFELPTTRSHDLFPTSNDSPWKSNTGELQIVNWKTDGEFNQVLKLDQSSGSFDSVFQVLPINAGEQYLLTFEHRFWDPGIDHSPKPETTGDIGVYWDGELVQRIRTIELWQTSSLQLTGDRDGLARLEFKEISGGAMPYGDGVGPLIDNVSVTASESLLINDSPGFEPENNDSRSFAIAGIAGWTPYHTTEKNSVKRRQLATQGEYVYSLNSSKRQDGIYTNVFIEAGQHYSILFDAKTIGGDQTELRVRWDDQWADTIRPTSRWQTYGITVESQKDGLRRLDFLEAGHQASQRGIGAYLDNIRLVRHRKSETQEANGRSGSSVILVEAGNFVTEQFVPIQLGNQINETRHVSFDVAVAIDDKATGPITEDLFNVYLVDPNDRSTVLLDNGIAGGALLSVGDGPSEFPPGLVTFNGTTVTIDVSSLGGLSDGELLFQLINSDTDDGSFVEVSNIESRIVEEAQQPVFLEQASIIVPGPSLNLQQLEVSTDIVASFSNIRFDSESRTYKAEAILQNNGESVGRNVALYFNTLVRSNTNLVNNSGTDPLGNPYVNFRNAIPSGGLPANTQSQPVELEFVNSNRTQFRLNAQVLVGEPNLPPFFSPIDPIVVTPGSMVSFELNATDPDDDPVTFSLQSPQGFPQTNFDPNGQITILPAPEDIGSYTLTVSASDGLQSFSQEVQVDVVNDPVTTTRVTGQVLDVNGMPLEGVPVDISGVNGITDVDGYFTIERPIPNVGDAEPTGPDGADSEPEDINPFDMLSVRGAEFVGDEAYPTVTEDLALLLEREGLYERFNNVIARPIFLPALDLEQADFVDGTEDVLVDATLSNGESPATLFVEAGNLQNGDGSNFEGDVSITEVPPNLTPAALPSNLSPDIVVTVQPGNMNFSVPAPLNLPNRVGFEPGFILDLWSINPATGLFENVGVGQVSSDGTIIETIDGGVNTSSWHFFAPPPPPPPPPSANPADGANEINDCEECKETIGNFEVELHSGVVLDDHALASYQSAGAVWQWNLHYDSLRADPRPIVHLGYSNLQTESDQRLVASLDILGAGQAISVPGYTGDIGGLLGGEHFWQVADAGNGRVALQADLTSLPSGSYEYQFRSGVFQFNGNQFAGSRSVQSGEIRSVNFRNSPFGAGWGLSGLQEIVESQDGSLLLIDGDGSELYFGPAGSDGIYQSPPGDFSTLSRVGGVFRRVFTDQTQVLFNDNNLISSITDRNNNTVSFHYDEDGIISRIVDPALLETTFEIVDGRVASITDPANRTTELHYDGEGNLTTVVDPDQTTNRWGYDGDHRLITHLNKRGFTERVAYDEFGRAESSVRKDGTRQFYDPVQTQVLQPASKTSDPFGGAVVSSNTDIVGRYADANGNVTNIFLDANGQLVDEFDSEGQGISIVRDEENLISQSFDGRGFETNFIYDDRGNLTRYIDQVVRDGATGSSFYIENRIESGNRLFAVSPTDLDGDGILDFVANTENGIQTFLNNGEGVFDLANAFGYPGQLRSLTTSDLNNDGFGDVVTTDLINNRVSAFLGIGDGTLELVDTQEYPNFQRPVAIDDIDGDAIVDMALISENGVNLRKGLGDGTFVSLGLIEVTANPLHVLLTDINNDNSNDLLVLTTANQVSVFIGNGDGTFGSEQAFQTNGNSQAESISEYERSSVVAADFNGDGQMDLATLNNESNDISVLVANTKGGFESPVIYTAGLELNLLQAVDATNDGFLDLVTSDRETDSLRLLPGMGDGTFGSVQIYRTGDLPQGFFVAELNGDEFPEAVVANFLSSDISVLEGQKGGGFESRLTLFTNIFPEAVATGDFNGDGFTDIISANTDRNGFTQDSVSVFFGLSDGSIAAPQVFDIGLSPSSTIEVADVNANGIDDIFIGSSENNSVQQILDGNFLTPKFINPGGRATDIDFIDVTNDGILDLVASRRDPPSPGSVGIMVGNGDGSFQVNIDIETLPLLPTSVSAGDLDGDGNIDLVVGGGDALIAVHYGLGGVNFEEPTMIQFDQTVSSLELAKIDDDDLLDIVVGNVAGDVSGYTFVINNGNRDFSFETLSTNILLVKDFKARDVNGDSITDLVAIHDNPNNNPDGIGFGEDVVSVTFGIGGAIFAEPQFFGANNPAAIAIDDVNADGILDIISSNVETVHLNVLFGRPTEFTKSQEYSYESQFNQLTRFVDELGRTTIYEIDPASGNRLSMTEVVGQLDNAGNMETDDLVTTYTYTTFGLVDTMTDPLGRVTDYDYNAIGRLQSITFAIGTDEEATVSYDYDLAGNQRLFIDELGNPTEFFYDELNRLETIIEADPDGPGPLLSPVTEFDYDESGNLTNITDAVDRTTVNEYDALDRLISTTDPIQNLTRYEYDLFGNLVKIIDPLTHTTTNEYDGRNRRVRTIDPDGGVTDFGYDADDNLTSLVDPVLNLTEFQYDVRDRLVTEIDPFGNRIEYQYDAVDNLIAKLDRNGRQTNFEYDDIDRLDNETWLDPNQQIVNFIDYGYDKASNLRTVDDFFSSLTFTYDNRDRVETTDNLGTPDTPNVLLTYIYNDFGNVRQLIEETNGSQTALTEYDYDALNRLSNIQQSGNSVADKSVDFEYNAINQYTQIARYADLVGSNLVAATDYQYDLANRLTDLDHTNASSTLLAFYDLGYDAASRIREIDDVDGLTTYSYDDRNQLTAADRDMADIRGNESYLYDANGNRLTSHLHDSDYETETANRLSTDGIYNYLYDDEGNMTRREQIATGDYREFAYDLRNRMTSVTDFSSGGIITQVVEYTYDALDRRIATIVDADGAGFGGEASTHFIYDREDVILDFADSDGPSGPSEPLLAQRYLHGPEIDQVLAQESSQIEWLLTDHLGTTEAIIDNSGAITGRYVFDEYGQVLQTIGVAQTRYLFTGREYQTETGLYFYRARFYNSSVGTFVSEDPIGLDSGEYNFRNYVANQPLFFIDPFGTRKCCPIGKEVLLRIMGLLCLGEIDDPASQDPRNKAPVHDPQKVPKRVHPNRSPFGNPTNKPATGPEGFKGPRTFRPAYSGNMRGFGGGGVSFPAGIGSRPLGTGRRQIMRRQIMR